MFADCDLSPLCPVHFFTVVLLLLSVATQNEVSHADLVTPTHAQHSEFLPMRDVFSHTRQPSERKKKDTSASKDTVFLRM